MVTAPTANTLEYLRILLQEYFTARTRAKVYPAEQQGNWRQRARLKRDRIDNTAARNGIPSPLQDEAQLQQARLAFRPAIGCPRFHYKDALDRQKYRSLDLRHYYAPGASVKFRYQDRVHLGTIDRLDAETVLVFHGDYVLPLPITDVTRLF